MVTLTLAGRSFEIAPYDIDDMLVAAPHVHALKGRKRPETITESLEEIKQIAAVVTVGLKKIDPEITITSVIKMALPDGVETLSLAMQEILNEFGLKPAGEAKAPAKRRKAAGA